jgi:hypothetical protein
MCPRVSYSEFTVRDRTIVYDTISTVADLPASYADEIEGKHFAARTQLSPEVEQTIQKVVELVIQEVSIKPPQ